MPDAPVVLPLHQSNKGSAAGNQQHIKAPQGIYGKQTGSRFGGHIRMVSIGRVVSACKIED